MTIDNFELLKDFMSFDSDDEFYFIQILKRKKENPEIPSNHNNVRRTVRSYYVYSKEYLNIIEKEIKLLCETNNARAYIHPTKRSFKKAGKLCATTVIDRVFNEQYSHIHKAYNTACGAKESRIGQYYWIVDIDNLDVNVTDKYEEILEPFHVETIPTKNGYHIITIPFRVDAFLQECSIAKLDNPDIQKNNPTLLYYKNNEEQLK